MLSSFIDLRNSDIDFTYEECKKAWGFVYYNKYAGQKEYLFSFERFKGAVCAGISPKVVSSDLEAKGFMDVHKGGKLTVQRPIPGLGKVRMISIKAKIHDAT